MPAPITPPWSPALRRRQWLGLALGSRLVPWLGPGSTAAALASLAPDALALPRQTLRFPRDAGSHNDFATEWWYLTGWVPAHDTHNAATAAGRGAGAAAWGFQVTFFRKRVAPAQGLASRLAARQLLFAHAAITDVAGQRHWHDQRIARWSGEAPGRNPADAAHASSSETAVTLHDWSLLPHGSGLRARIAAGDFALDLLCTPTQPVLLQGDEGLSRKGPQAQQASYYYSLPQLAVQGDIVVQGRRHTLAAGSTAWLDHEWSQEVLHPRAVGWDWIGINLFDGGALTAFQLRTADAQALWDGGSLRTGAGQRSVFDRGAVRWQALRHWVSPASRARYPVHWQVDTPAGRYTIRALVDAQELDSRNTVGTIYWEGLCEAYDSHGQLCGRGYLEMTGYAGALRM